MTTKLSSIIKVGTEQSNKLFINYFIGVNIIYLLTNILLYKLGQDLYLLHIQFNILMLVLMLIPLKILSAKIDRPVFFKYLFLALYIFYIFSIVLIGNKIDVYSLVMLLSLNVFGIIYMSENIYLITTIIAALATMIFSKSFILFAPENNVVVISFYRSIIVILVSLGIYVGLTRMIHLMRGILNDNVNPYIDNLTGVYNKHYLKEKMANIPFGEGIQLSIIALGIDNMKDVNGKYGASAGDKVLQDLIEILKHLTRQGDSICRTEGDKFAIILQHPKEFQAENLAARIKHSLDVRKFNVINKDSKQEEVGITLSFGVVTLKEGEDSEKLLERAEKALGEAKKKGKNRIEKDE